MMIRPSRSAGTGFAPASLFALFSILFGFGLVPFLSGAPIAGIAPKAGRQKVLAAAAALKGTPYRYGGISPQGLDCSGLVYLSFREALGVAVPRTTKQQYAWADPLAEEKLQAGDLVFFRTTADAAVSHVGIYAGDRRFIHAASDGRITGVIESSLDEDYWRRAYLGAGRLLPAREFLGILIGVGAAPSWDPFGVGGLLRGAAFHGGVAYDLRLFGKTFRPGAEIRAEWDGTLGVFRLPLTLSLGFGDELRFFAGPALSLGNANLATRSGARPYRADGGFFGALGVAWAPLSFRFADGHVSLFGELAYQTYTRDPSLAEDWAFDSAANLRISTGLRYRWTI
jgi:probable lipoprotein NlpC